MSWDQLIAIKERMKQEAREERTRPIVACPHCGEPLDEARGVLHCPWGHFQTTRKTGRSLAG
jgi:hypothetical protein